MLAASEVTQLVFLQDIQEIGPGEICAIFGIDCASGDTFTDGTTNFSMVCTVFPCDDLLLT